MTQTFAPLGQIRSWSSVSVSADGSRMAFGRSTGTGLVTLSMYDSSTGEFAYRSAPGFSSQLSLNRSGTLIANGGKLLNADFTSYGNVNAGRSAILSPAGDLFELRFDPTRFGVFDTSSPASICS